VFFADVIGRQSGIELVRFSFPVCHDGVEVAAMPSIARG
jgi:hypothetical protein